jgi:hypothetical protein
MYEVRDTNEENGHEAVAALFATFIIICLILAVFL